MPPLARAGGAYVVRDDDAGARGARGAHRAGGAGGARGDSPDARPGNVDKLYPYTLRGLTDALEEARFRSFAGPPQVVMVMGEGGMRVIRRYEQGRERPADEASG